MQVVDDVNTSKDNKPELALEIIGGKWKMPILWRLGWKEVWRYSELKQDLGHISHKMLSQQLKELEKDGLIIRTLYPVVPPKVEYQISDRGKLALPVITALCNLHSSLASDIYDQSTESVTRRASV